MSYQAIHAPALGSEEDAKVFKAAAELAALHGARLTIVSAFTPPAVQMAYVAAPNFYVDPGLVEELEKGQAEARERVRVAASAAADHAGLAFGKDVVIAEYKGTAWEAGGEWLPLSDLVVLGPVQAAGDLAADLLLRARAPVLVARPGLRLKPMTAAVAWDGSLCAGRAVKAALPLLAKAERVILMQQPDAIPEARRAAADLGRLADYLGRHGLDIVTESVPGDEDKGETLLEALRCTSADVLVCGAYGHSRLAETVLGGVTRSVLKAAFPSAFLCH